MHYAQQNDWFPIVEMLAPTLRGIYVETPPVQRGHAAVVARNTQDQYHITFEYGSFADILPMNRILSQKVLKLPSAIERWQKYVTDPHAATDVDTLTETAEAVLDFVAEFGPKALTFSGLHPAEVQCEHLATLLRATSLWREEIPGWKEALGVAELAIEANDLDSSDVLFGMV